MVSVLPSELDEIISRIGAPAAAGEPSPDDVTGELALLLDWWHTVSDGAPPRSALLAPPMEDVAPTGDAASSIRAGCASADRAIDGGANLLIPRVGECDPIAALTVIGLLTRTESSALAYQVAGMTDREWMQRCTAVRDRAVEVADLRADPLGLLDALDAGGIAFVAGCLLTAAARRTPCIVDGTDELAAALLADCLSFRAKDWWRSGSTSPDPARRSAVVRLDLAEGLPLGLGDDRGLGARATLALLGMLTT